MSHTQLEEALAQLKAKDFAIRRDVMQTLAEIADAEAVVTIIGLLQDPNWLIRSRAAEALGAIRHPSAVPMLIATLQNQAEPEMESGIYHVYDCAAKALGKIGTEPALFALREMLAGKDVAIRFRAARALLEAGDISAVPVLLTLIQVQDHSVRYSAIRVLGEAGEVTAVPALLGMLNVPAIPVPIQAAAAEAVQKMGDSETLPRKILACSRFTPQERIHLLEQMRRLRFRGGTPSPVSLRYTIPEVRALCRKVLTEEDEQARAGAQIVLNWLNGERDLLLPSQRPLAGQSETLLRAVQGNRPETRPETLLKASQAPPQEQE